MPTVTLLEKLYSSISTETFEQFYAGLVSGLNVQLRFAGTTNRGWIQLDVSGADETAALSLLDREIGLAPVSMNKLKKASVIRGKIVFSNKSTEGLHVDLGVHSPHVLDAVLSEKLLCGQLADGKKVSLQKLVELFCLVDDLPLEVKVVQGVLDENKNVEACLSEAQLASFSNWVRCGFDRLIVLGCQLSDVERAVKVSRHSRDVIKVESLGVLEQVVLCKLGTDAVGLIPKVGRYLKSAVLVPFSPKKIVEAIGSQPFGMLA